MLKKFLALLVIVGSMVTRTIRNLRRPAGRIVHWLRLRILARHRHPDDEDWEHLRERNRCSWEREWLRQDIGELRRVEAMRQFQPRPT